MITTKQYIDNYNRWTKMLHDYNDNIEKSTECRKTLIKNADTADVLDLLQEAVNCIYDMTGDVCFLKSVTNSIERRRK